MNAKQQDYKAKARQYLAVGEIALWRRGDDLNANDWFKKALEIHKTHDDKHGIATCYRGLADCAAQTEHLPDTHHAKELYYLALSLFEAVGDKKGQANCLVGLGETEYQDGNISGAERHYRSAGLLYREIGSDEGIGNYY